MQNEPVYSYAPGTEERRLLKEALKGLAVQQPELFSIIHGKQIAGKRIPVREPHAHASILGHLHEVGASEIQQAIQTALLAKKEWELLSQQERNEIFLRAADLVAGKYRYLLNAATMLGQSKNAYQAEIDSACELADFLRFNVAYAQQIQAIQPASAEGIHNALEYRPLEGFVVAITPFNFTAIAANLPTAPVLMGNVCVWKPAYTQARSAQVLMEIFQEAGIPPGVLNLVYADGPLLGKIAFSHPEFAGLHFTGSTAVFQQLWQQISNQLTTYRQYPKLVGETGGKDFVWMHPSASVDVTATALVRGAFEYQGQKCSAASRAYIPKSRWSALREQLVDTTQQLRMGDVRDFRNFVNAVIDERAYDRISSYWASLKNGSANVLTGASGDKQEGYFIQPTLAEVFDPAHVCMREELFGPVLSIYVYDDARLAEIPELINQTSDYALTGAVLAEDEIFLKQASTQLRYAAGNFYINDKPTGAVVNQQPFGGARRSGTNDKAGSMHNLLRWVSAACTTCCVGYHHEPSNEIWHPPPTLAIHSCRKNKLQQQRSTDFFLIFKVEDYKTWII